jgi:GTP cyclohydrolase I
LATLTEDLVKKILIAIGEDPDREGLLDTPKRVVESWKTLFSGYGKKPKDILTTKFTEQYDEMVICKNIEFYSNCEHHMLPFYGKCHIAYVPEKQIIGLSKMPRLLEIFARRLQVQERLTEQIADAMMTYVKPKGVGVSIEAKHMCMVCRGVHKQNSSMITTALRGVFKDDHCKLEFQNSVK